MFVILYLCLATEILLVTANPLLQFLPQSCPVCQQNYQNIPPLLQPRNINSYIPTNSVPNPVAPCQNPSDQLNQLILNKIFSNPTLRTILDPNTKLYGQNGVEIQRQIPSTTNVVPNVINNYIIIPPELIFNGTEEINAKNNVRNERRVNRNGNKNGSNAKRRGNVGPARGDNIDQARKEKINKLHEERKSVHNQTLINGDTEIKRERRKHRRKQGRTRQIENKVDENVGLTDYVREIQHQVEREDGSVAKALNTDLEKQVSIFESPKNNDPNHSSLKCDICKTEDVKAISNPELNEHKQDKTQKHPTPRNENRKVDGKIAKPKVGPDANVNPKQTNQEEALIQDFHQKYPGIPKEVIRDLLAYLKRQMQNEQLGMPNFYYPYPIFPLTYDQLFQNQFAYPQGDDSGSKKTRRKSNRRSRNKKCKDQTNEPECETTVELTPTEENDVPATTEDSINTAPTDAVPSSPKSTMATTAELQRTPLADIIEDTTPKPLKSEDTPEYVSSRDALGTEDVVPTIFVNGIVNDYYPDFTADNQAYSLSNEDYNLKNLIEDRYQYTTDKNMAIEEYYRERRKYPSNNNENQIKTIEDETGRTSEEIETTIARPMKEFFVEESEEIHYKVPPKLEVPDFVTRKVNGDFEQNESDVYYDRDDEEYFKKYIDNTEVHKASTFSDAKTPQYNLKGKPKKVGADVETVFAKSKVVKFGYGRDYNDITAPTPRVNDNEPFKTNEEQPTIVIAKSYPEDFWY